MQTMNFKAIPTPRGPEESSDPGFGAVVSTASGRRLLNPDGSFNVRRYRPLPLDRSKVTFFPLSWTIVHPITPESPLWGLSPEQLEVRNAEFLLLLSGIDDTFAATVHARTSYKAEQVVWDRKFTNIFDPPGDDGVLSMDISRLDEVQEAR